MSELTEALLAIQSSSIEVQKDSLNPHFRNRYISLNALMDKVLPILNAAGIVLIQSPSITSGGAPALLTELVHAKTGESIESKMPLMLDKANPQGQGSAITYARRYSLMSILGLVADEDDDGTAASSYGHESQDAVDAGTSGLDTGGI